MSSETAEKRTARITPGPWLVVDHLVCATDDGGVVCRRPDMPDNQKNWDADAPALAAVPDLVRALESVEPYLDAITCYASTINEHDGNRVAALVRSALLLARGDAS